jgi:hypothetical protein
MFDEYLTLIYFLHACKYPSFKHDGELYKQEADIKFADSDSSICMRVAVYLYDERRYLTQLPIA